MFVSRTTRTVGVDFVVDEIRDFLLVLHSEAFLDAGADEDRRQQREFGRTDVLGQKFPGVGSSRSVVLDTSQFEPVGMSLKGRSRSTRISPGRVRTRSAMMLRRISSVPAAMRMPGAAR